MIDGPEVFFAACAGKQPFDCKADALRVVKARDRRRGFRGRGGGEVAIYRCDYCHKFHIGHRPVRARELRH